MWRGDKQIKKGLPQSLKGYDRNGYSLFKWVITVGNETIFSPLVADFPDTYKLIGQDEVSKTYSFPKSYISYRKPRAVSAEQRERVRQMMIERNREK